MGRLRLRWQQIQHANLVRLNTRRRLEATRSGPSDCVTPRATLSLVFGPAAAIFALLLVATGIAKLRRPEDTAIALSKMGLPRLNALGRVIGAVEVGVGVFVLTTFSVVALAFQALLYIGFTGWIATALLKGTPIANCGCLGTDDTPPYWGHLVIDIGAVAVTVAALLADTFIYPREILGSVAMLAVITLGAYLCWAIIGDGARLYRATSR